MSDSNVESQLKKLNGESVELPKPQSRVELYLAKLNGESVELPEPQSRVEELLFNLTQKTDTDELDFIRNHYKVINDTSNEYGYWNEDGLYVPTVTFDVVIPDWVTNTHEKTHSLQNGNINLWTCGNERTVIGNNVQYLEAYAYSMKMCAPGASKLESIYFPKLSSGQNMMFAFNDALKNVTIKEFPNNQSGQNAFYECVNLENVTIISDIIKTNLYLYWSNKLTQECLHSLIEKYANYNGSNAVTFWIGEENIAKIDEAHMQIFENNSKLIIK